MTTGYFTKIEISFAERKPIKLIDMHKLNELLTKYELTQFTPLKIDINDFLNQLNDNDISMDDATDALIPLNQFCGYFTLHDLLTQNTHNYGIRTHIIDLMLHAYI